MIVYEQQVENELNFAKENKSVSLDKYRDKLLDPCLTWFETYKLKPAPLINADGTVREDLLEIIPAVLSFDAEEVIWDILSKVILEQKVTLQALMGMYFERLPVELPYRKGRVLEPFLEAVLASPFIEQKRIGKYIYLICTRRINVDVSNYAYVLPSLTNEPVRNNADAGYEHVPFHVITGGKLKQHDGELCLDHINRLNSVNYTTDDRLFKFVEPVFDSKRKFLEKKDRYENEVEVEERRKQYDIWRKQLPQRMGELRKMGNKFYFKNRYCTRGRTYIKAWHLDYIGNKFIRALVNTSIKEIVTGSSKYL